MTVNASISTVTFLLSNLPSSAGSCCMVGGDRVRGLWDENFFWFLFGCGLLHCFLAERVISQKHWYRTQGMNPSLNCHRRTMVKFLSRSGYHQGRGGQVGQVSRFIPPTCTGSGQSGLILASSCFQESALTYQSQHTLRYVSQHKLRPVSYIITINYVHQVSIHYVQLRPLRLLL